VVLVAVPPSVVTVILPVVAPAGTAVTILVDVSVASKFRPSGRLVPGRRLNVTPMNLMCALLLAKIPDGGVPGETRGRASDPPVIVKPFALCGFSTTKCPARVSLVSWTGPDR